MAEDPSPDTDVPDEQTPTDPAVERAWRPGPASASASDAPPEPDPTPDAPSGPEGEAERPPTEEGPADGTTPRPTEQGPPAEPPAEEAPTPPESGHRPDAEDGSRPSDEPVADDPPRDASAPEEGPDPSTSAAPPSPDASPSTTSSAPAPNDDAPRTGEAADGDAPDREAAREDGKQINEEAFADAADERSWTDRLDETDDRPDAARAHDPDRDDFYTDQRHGVHGAEQIEEEIQDFVHETNDGPAGTDWTPAQVEARKTATMFAILVSKVAEDMSYQRQPGDEFWDPRKIMRRQIDNRPLRHCKMDYTKRRLALLVDTSPSCRDEAVFYSKIASGAMLRDDIDIFLCPNGRIDARFDPEPMRFVDDDRGGDWALDGRTVLYFTDWDGADEIVTHSRACNLYWFDNCSPGDYWESSRDRYQRVRLQYRGRHFHCPDPDAFQRLARKIRP
ncbi:MAG: hypothetical protein ABEL97_14770 [Salinibacter sp.]